MSTSIDERIVEMRFDNQHFENNVKTSMSTIDKLKERLNLTGATKGLENIDTASKNVNMSGISGAVETVQLKFSALQVMAVTALANITNSAVNAGKKIVSALTIDPIATGFKEYETQINAVQTILANTSSKGTTLQQVNAALDTLNTYADKTIYNFTEMTRNIGTFTAAGVDLDTSVKSIQGIANLAAVSGSTSQQASTAMYQLSQALAAGRVNLQDWNSVVNAGMGGQVFQDALVRTAAALDGSGKSIDSWRKKNIDAHGSFRESLTKGGWMTTEVLTKTLEQFTLANNDANRQMLISQGYTEDQAKAILTMAETASDAATKVKTFTQLWDTLKETAQSGWTKTWQIIIGDFGEAKEFLTKISDTIGPMIDGMSDARNKLLTGGLSSGWKQLLGAGIVDEDGYKTAIRDVVKEHNVALDEMIEKEGSFEKALVSGLKSGSITSDMLSTSVTKLGDKIRGMSEEQLTAAGYTKEHVTSLEALESGLQNGTTSMDEFVAVMSKSSGRENLITSLENVFDGLLSVIKPITEAFRDIFPPMTGKQLYAFTEGLKEFTSKLKLSEEQSEKLKSTFKGLFTIISVFVDAIKAVLGVGLKLLGLFGGLINAILSIGSSVGGMVEGFTGAVKEADTFGETVEKVSGFINNMVSKIKEFGVAVKERFITPGFESFLGVLGKVWDVMKTIGSKIAGVGSQIGKAIGNAFSGDFSTVFDIINGGLLAALLLSVKRFTGNITSTIEDLGGIKGIIGGIKSVFNSLKDTLETFQNRLKADILMKLAGAIAVLTASIVILSLIDSEKLAYSLGAITVLFADLMGSMAIFDKIKISGAKKVTTIITAMIGMSIAVLILAGALKKISDIDSDKMFSSIAAITALSAVLVATAMVMSKGKGRIMKGAISLIIFAAAIKILASATKDMATLSWDKIERGLVGVGVLMGAVSLFMNNTKFSLRAVGTAIAVLAIAGAVKILASACSDFGNLNPNEMTKGLAAIGALLLEIAIFSKLTGKSTNIVSTGIALVLIAGAVKIFASAIGTLSKLSWEQIGKGLAAMAGSLLAVALAVALMPKNMLGVGAGMILISTALVILSKSLTTMGSMSWGEVARGLAVLGGSLLILSLALSVMQSNLLGALSLIVVAGALSIMAPVIKSLGSMSWEQIAKGLLTLAGAFVIIGVAGLVLTPLAPIILALSVAFLLFGTAILAVGAGMTLLTMGLSLLGTVAVTGATGFVNALGIMVTGVMDLLPLILYKVVEIITGICGAIIESIPVITTTITTVILAILKVIVEVIPAVITTIGVLLDSWLNFMVTYIPKMVEVGMKLILGILTGISNNIGGIVETAIQIVINFLDAIASQLPKVIDSGFKLIIAFINGLAEAIRGNTEPLMAAVRNLFDAVIEAGKKILKGSISTIKDIGKDIMESGLIKGIKDKIGNFLTTIRELPTKAVSAIKEYVGNFKNVAGDLVNGLIDGLKGKASSIATEAKNIGANLLKSVKNKLGINSPSREFMEVGKFSVMGLTEGLSKYAKNAVNSAKELGGKTINSLSNAIANISDIISDDVDMNPTIRPVLDLSDVRAGASSIGGMLNGRSVAFSAAGTISESMLNFQNGNDNSDIVSAIKGLRNDLSNVSGNTYNVNGITYDDGSNVVNAVSQLVRATKIERRV